MKTTTTPTIQHLLQTKFCPNFKVSVTNNNNNNKNNISHNKNNNHDNSFLGCDSIELDLVIRLFFWRLSVHIVHHTQFNDSDSLLAI